MYILRLESSAFANPGKTDEVVMSIEENNVGAGDIKNQ